MLAEQVEQALLLLARVRRLQLVQGGHVEHLRLLQKRGGVGGQVRLQQAEGLLEPAQVQQADAHVVDHNRVVGELTVGGLQDLEGLGVVVRSYKGLKMEVILLPIDGAEVFIHIFQNIKRPI